MYEKIQKINKTGAESSINRVLNSLFYKRDNLEKRIDNLNSLIADLNTKIIQDKELNDPDYEKHTIQLKYADIRIFNYKKELSVIFDDIDRYQSLLDKVITNKCDGVF